MTVTRAYEEFLQKEGYRPSIGENGMIQFKVEGRIYLILPDEQDAQFFRMIFPGFFGLEGDAQRQAAYVAAHEAGATVKVGKILIQGDQVHAVVESVLPELEAIPRVFERAQKICVATAQKFMELMKSAAGAKG